MSAVILATTGSTCRLRIQIGSGQRRRSKAILPCGNVRFGSLADIEARPRRRSASEAKRASLSTICRSALCQGTVKLPSPSCRCPVYPRSRHRASVHTAIPALHSPRPTASRTPTGTRHPVSESDSRTSTCRWRSWRTYCASLKHQCTCQGLHALKTNFKAGISIKYKLLSHGA